MPFFIKAHSPDWKVSIVTDDEVVTSGTALPTSLCQPSSSTRDHWSNRTRWCDVTGSKVWEVERCWTVLNGVEPMSGQAQKFLPLRRDQMEVVTEDGEVIEIPTASKGASIPMHARWLCWCDQFIDFILILSSFQKTVWGQGILSRNCSSLVVAFWSMVQTPHFDSVSPAGKQFLKILSVPEANLDHDRCREVASFLHSAQLILQQCSLYYGIRNVCDLLQTGAQLE